MRQHAEIINIQPPKVEPTPQLVQSTGQWITSAPTAHEPLVDDRTFHRAQPRTSGDRPGDDRAA